MTRGAGSLLRRQGFDLVEELRPEETTLSTDLPITFAPQVRVDIVQPGSHSLLDR